MDPFVPFALTLGMVIAASQQAAIMEQYAARARQLQPAAVEAAWDSPPVAYAAAPPLPPPVPGWVAGAAAGSQIGALVGASNPVLHCRGHACAAGIDPRPMIAGAVIGGLIGHAATTPPPVAYAGTPQPVAEPAAAPYPRSTAASREFTDHWQNFMQPSVSRSAAPAQAPGWGR